MRLRHRPVVERLVEDLVRDPRLAGDVAQRAARRGGPVFLGGFNSNLIVAVTSFGLNALCRGTDFAYRIDRQEVLDWINSQN